MYETSEYGHDGYVSKRTVRQRRLKIFFSTACARVEGGVVLISENICRGGGAGEGRYLLGTLVKYFLLDRFLSFRLA